MPDKKVSASIHRQEPQVQNPSKDVDYGDWAWCLRRMEKENIVAPVDPIQNPQIPV